MTFKTRFRIKYKGLDAKEDGDPPYSIRVVCADYITPYINSQNAKSFEDYTSNRLSLHVESDEPISQTESCTVKIQSGSDLKLQITQ